MRLVSLARFKHGLGSPVILQASNWRRWIDGCLLCVMLLGIYGMLDVLDTMK